ncbi:MAG: hypothetical protein N2C14_25065, partial [Planctomycetales bacterium]
VIQAIESPSHNEPIPTRKRQPSDATKQRLSKKRRRASKRRKPAGRGSSQQWLGFFLGFACAGLIILVTLLLVYVAMTL